MCRAAIDAHAGQSAACGESSAQCKRRNVISRWGATNPNGRFAALGVGLFLIVCILGQCAEPMMRWSYEAPMPVGFLVRAGAFLPGIGSARQRFAIDPCRLVRQVSEIRWLELLRLLGKTPAGSCGR